MKMSSNRNASARESFESDTGGIDWLEAASEMDRLLSSSNCNGEPSIGGRMTTARELPASIGATARTLSSTDDNHAVGNSSSYSSSLDDGQMRMITAGSAENLILQNHLCKPPQKSSDLTAEQLARMEGNRRNALEKRRLLKSQQPQSSPEQPARFERNRLEALARREHKLTAQSTSLTVPSTHIHSLSSSSYGSGTNHLRIIEEGQQMGLLEMRQQSPLTKCSDGQRARMEENRRLALERRQTLSQSTNTDISSHPSPVIANEDQRARMEMNRRKALDMKQHLMSQQLEMDSSTTNVNLLSPIKLAFPIKSKIRDFPPKITNDACARMGGEQHIQPPLHEPTTVEYFTCSSRLGGENLDVESLTAEGKTVCAKVDQHTAGLDELEIMRSRVDDDRKPPARELFITDDVTSDLHDAKAAPTPKKTALPPLPPDLQYDESRVLPIDDDHTDTLIMNAEMDEPLLNGWTLFDHQKEGVRRALKMRRLILAFDMGLGKTIIGCVWAKSFKNVFAGIKIFVIAPPSLHEDWQRTATDATGLKFGHDGKKCRKGKAKMKKEDDDEGKYERTVTGKRRKKGKKEIKSDSEDENESSSNIEMYIFSWDGISACKNVILDVSDYVVIADEAHCMQSMETKRTKEALTLMCRKKCRGVLLLSGTPMKNGRPSNLFPLLRAVQHPFGDNQKRYEFYFCNGQQKLYRGRETWDATGSSNLKELNAHIAQHLFRLTKEECLLELPPRKREVVRIPVPSRHELHYKQALKDLAEALRLSRTHCGGESDDVLSLFQRLHQISAIAKVDAIATLANSILVEEGSVVIFTSFVAVAKEIHQKLEHMDWKGELLTGETAAKKRQAMVDRFQACISPVFVATYGVGGVGLTLTVELVVYLW